MWTVAVKMRHIIRFNNELKMKKTSLSSTTTMDEGARDSKEFSVSKTQE